MSRPVRFLLLLLLVLSFLGPLPARAADPLIPDRPASAPAYAGTRPLYDDDRFQPYRYTFDVAQQQDSTAALQISFWINTLMVAKAWLLKTTLRVAEYALKVDFLAPFLDQVTQVLTLQGETFWDGQSPWVAGALTLVGIWAMILYLGGRVGRVWATLGGSVLILMLTTVVLTEGPAWIEDGSALSREVSTAVFSGIEEIAPVTNPTWGLIGHSGDALWRTLVYEPWLTGEFGDPRGEVLYGQPINGSFLTKNFAQRQELCAPRVTDIRPECPWWAHQYLPWRMVFAGWTFLATLLVSGSLLVLAGGIIGAQLALLLILTLCPVWMLVALWWPEQGRRILTWIGLRALGALVLQALLAITLGLLLLLNLTVTGAFSGWMLRSIILAVLAVAAFRYRTAWLEPLAAARQWNLERSSSSSRDVAVRMPARYANRQIRQSTVTVAEVPAFAGVAPGFQRPDPSASGWDPIPDEPSEHLTVPGEPAERPGRFRTEMQTLRERLVGGDMAARSGAGSVPTPSPGPRTVAPMDAPPAGPEALRTVAAARQRLADVAKLPNQRPQK